MTFKQIPAAKTVFCLGLLLVLFTPAVTRAGEWRVTPIRLDFDREAKSGVISVVNEGKDKFQVQMKAFTWTQDETGKDHYAETADIIFFPKFMLFEQPEERILRAGIKTLPTSGEKTYRLFVEEIPEPRKAEGTNISIAIRFGVPIFVKPAIESAKGEITAVSMKKGEASVAVRNSGNVHFVINSVNFTAKSASAIEVFTNKAEGWYLLNGAARVYSTVIPKEVCSDVAKLDVEVKTNRFILNGKLDVDKSMCQ